MSSASSGSESAHNAVGALARTAREGREGVGGYANRVGNLGLSFAPPSLSESPGPGRRDKLSVTLGLSLLPSLMIEVEVRIERGLSTATAQ